MEINLSKESFVDQRTGEVSAPTEYLENLRDIERAVTRIDEDIDRIKYDLKVARNCREELVTKLRAAVREGKVLPLLEVLNNPPDEDVEDVDEVDDGPEL